MSWQNIISNKMRSFLTILGIVIGVLSIITLVTVMQGASKKVTDEFSNLGTGKISITAPGTSLKKGLSQKDVDKLLNIEHVSGVSPNVNFITSVKKGNKTQKEVLIDGKNEYYFYKNSSSVKDGRAINYLDVKNKNRVCIINQKLQKSLFFGENPIGKDITVNSISLKVIGILNNDSNSEFSSEFTSISNQDYTIMVPYTTAMKLTYNYNVSSLDLYIDDALYTNQITKDVKTVINEAFNYKENSFNVLNLDYLIDSMKSITSMLSSVMGGIASIALLVGGIGIMNMMLVSVTERTKEIGLRKALGAEPRRIQLQFLIESVVLSLLGGFIGLLLGLFLSWVICLAIEMPFVISINSILLAVGFSGAVGIIFGWAPARKASMLNPIDALRSE